MFSLLVAAIVATTVQNVPWTPGAREALHLSCPVGHATRIVLPEPLLRLRAPGQNAALAVSVERTRPQGVLVVTPRTHPVRAILNVRGEKHDLRISIESTASGEAGDIRITYAATEPTVTAAPSVAPARPTDATTDPPTSAPTLAPTPRADGLDAVELMRAKVVVVAEREGLPGQPAMVLTDALQGERYVWLRFLLEGGAGARVSRVSWEGGAIESFTQEPQDKDLRVIVRVDRPAITRRAHVSLEIEEGATYTFAMDARPLKELLR